MRKQTINRYNLVRRHYPIIRKVEPHSPLSVGNGEFAYTADITGLQSFPECYDVPLGTQSQWGWHSTNRPQFYGTDDIKLHPYETHGRSVGYATHDDGQETQFHWLRQNPHRLQLVQIGFKFYDKARKELNIGEIHKIEQTLDLWRGVLISHYEVNGTPVHVQTCCHPHKDQLAVRVESALIDFNQLEVVISFPSPHPVSRVWEEDTRLKWESQLHTTNYKTKSHNSGLFIRTADQESYYVETAWTNGEMIESAPHQYHLVPKGNENFEFTAAFSPAEAADEINSFQKILQSSEIYWQQFWMEGGAVELSGSLDSRALELERRIVLSQYLTAIHCSGSLPPQETGLLYNSWFGKFHLEMHWWHAVHFALWGRFHLLKKSLNWYRHILPEAQKLARSQGYRGARWPKMVGPDGRDSPSPIGPLLIWQQPHPIVYAELCYLAEPTDQTLHEFRELVLETAEFMASYAVWSEQRKQYILGPPVIPAQEEYDPRTTWNPTFELEYWRHGLELAQVWRERLGMSRMDNWQHICDHLADLPEADGVYLAHEHAAATAQVNRDHPSMLGALGMLPGKKAEAETMRRTLVKVMQEWQWDTAWGWDFPLTAMTAARLGERDMAVDALMMEAAKNTYLINGHNYQREGLSAYLPGNGGLLTAVAMMARGWMEGPEEPAPGFPKNGLWTVRSEGLSVWM